MQKNTYYYQNSFKYRVRIICSKNVTASELPKYWDATLESMLKLIESVHRGVYGLVKDIEGKTIQRAIIRVKGPFQSIRVTEAGEYWKLLPQGKSYNITASAWGHIEETKEVAVTNEEPYVRVDFVLNFRRIHGTVRDKEGNLIQNFFILGCSISRPFTGGLYSSLFDFEDTGEHCEITASARGYIEETKSVHLTKDELNVSIDFVLDQARVYGVVRDTNSNPVLEAVIKKVEYKIYYYLFDKTKKIKLGEKSTGVNEQGEYSMPLEKLKNTYDLIVSAPGYKTKTTSVFATREDPHIQLDFKLRKPFFKCSGN